jgi:glucose dehydrogenase
VAYGDGKIFLYQADTTLVALDAKTGKVVWSAKNGDASKGETGTSAPMVVNHKVYVGISGGEFGVRGHLTAYDTRTGKMVWRAYSTGPDSEMLVDPRRRPTMDYEPLKVAYTAGQPYVGATLTMSPAPGGNTLGNFIAWDADRGKIVWSVPEQFSVWSGALATAGDVVFYGTLEGYLKAVDDKTGKELFRFKTPSGIIGNINT